MWRLRVIFAAVVVGLGGILVTGPTRSVQGESRPLPADLATVPANALGFAHIPVAALWNHPEFKPWQAVFEKAGQKTISLLDDRFAPKPSTTDRVTMVLMPPGPNKPNRRRSELDFLNPTLILHFSAPYDRDAVKQAHASQSKSKQVGGREMLVATKSEVAMAFLDDRTLVLGEESGVTAILTPTDKPNPFTAILQQAATGQAIVAAVNVKQLPIPAEALAEIPDPFKPLTELELVSVQVSVTPSPQVDLRLSFPNAESAKSGEKAFRKLTDLGRIGLDQVRNQISAELNQHLNKKGTEAKPSWVRPLGDFPQAALMVAGLGGLNFADDLLAHPPIEVQGADLVGKVSLPAWTSQFIIGGSLAAGIMAPTVQKVREASMQAEAMNNLKQIGLAMHNYHDTYGHFPPAVILGKKGQKLHSWRTAILPYIEQDALYRQIKLDEPWDSEHNKKFTDVSIRVYMDPRIEMKPAHTVYKLPVGNGAMFDWVIGQKLTAVTDGLSNTFMVLAGGEQVPWAKPVDYEYDPKVGLPEDFAKDFDNQLLAAFGDGSVRTINLTKLKNRAQTLQRLIERNDGNVVNIEE